MNKALTQDQAIALYDTEWWKEREAADIVAFQLFTERLCMPFDKFQAAVEAALARPVFTHEFAYADNLRQEFLRERPAPTLEEIIGLIPAEKLIAIGVRS